MAASGGHWKGGSFAPAKSGMAATASSDYTGAPSFGREEKTKYQYGPDKGTVYRRVIPVERQTTGKFGGNAPVAKITWTATSDKWVLSAMGGAALGEFGSLREAKKAAVSEASRIDTEAQAFRK